MPVTCAALDGVSQRVVVGDESLQPGIATVSYRLPSGCLRADGDTVISLHHPQASCPVDFGVSNDPRCLGFMMRNLRVLRLGLGKKADMTVLPPCSWPAGREAMASAVEAATKLEPRSLSLCFESLGRNCEFGLVQRHFGAEPLGLLRFASITLEDLLNGLRKGFAGVGEDIVVRTAADPGQAANPPREYMVHDERYNIGLHSFLTTDEADAPDVHAAHSQRLRFLHWMFMDRLTTGERIFVLQRAGRLTL